MRDQDTIYMGGSDQPYCSVERRGNVVVIQRAEQDQPPLLLSPAGAAQLADILHRLAPDRHKTVAHIRDAP